jgi:hypothetical protein
VIFKADGERRADGTRPWTFVASGELPRGEIVRTDAASAERCLAIVLPRLRSLGVSIPE